MTSLSILETIALDIPARTKSSKSSLHQLEGTTDVEEAQWFSIYDLPELAFDHKGILEYALKRLRYKLEYTTVGFQLLPKEFTLTELQKVYEIILKKSLDKRNFRKKILSLNLLEPIPQKIFKGAHRPAQLYTFKKKEIIFTKGVI